MVLGITRGDIAIISRLIGRLFGGRLFGRLVNRLFSSPDLEINVPDTGYSKKLFVTKEYRL
jgi:hypothetical protein